MDVKSIAAHIQDHITVHVYGAAASPYENPIQSLRPVFGSYRHMQSSHDNSPIAIALRRILPGGSLRIVQTSRAPSGKGIVFDRDLFSTWRLSSARVRPHRERQAAQLADDWCPGYI